MFTEIPSNEKRNISNRYDEKNMINLMKKYFLFLVFAGVTYGAFSQQPLYLIPSPRQVVINPGVVFRFTGGMKVFPGIRPAPADTFSAQQLAEECTKELGINLTFTARPRKAVISFYQIGTDGDGKAFFSDSAKQVASKIGKEGYYLEVTPASIRIVANTSAGIFYGVQTLKQLIRANRQGNTIPCLAITDWPAMKYRGWMDDVSRGPIPSVGFVKEEIRTMAEYKQNFFNLYTEHVFCLKSHPDIAPADGFSPAEIAELQNYASRYHIELIGNQQCFGHQEHVLEIPFYRNISDNGWILNPGTAATYQYLSDVLGEEATVYSSSFFNINCDETQGLGSGNAKRFVDSLGMEQVYAYHINRINDILKKYNKRIMMWGDIAVNHKAIINQLPHDLIVLSWGYGAEESFDKVILPFSQSGFNFMIAPGVSCWGQIYPDLTSAAKNISNYVRDGAKLGAMGMMNTCWDDDGENLFNYNWHGLVWGAECSWKPAPPVQGEPSDRLLGERLNGFNQAFDRIFFGLTQGSITRLLFRFDELRDLPVRDVMRDWSFWQDVLQFNIDKPLTLADSVNRELERKASVLYHDLIAMRPQVRFHQDALDGAVFAAKRMVFLGKKNLLSLALQADFINPSQAEASAHRELASQLEEELYTIKCEYIRLWHLENRGWWLDRNLARYDGLCRQLMDFDQHVYVILGTPRQDGMFSVTMRTLYNDFPVYYTTDGTEPVLSSAKYTTPVMLDRPSLIRARVINGKDLGKITDQFVLVNKALGCLSQLNSTYSSYNAAYSGGGKNALTDGIRGSSNFADGHWQGFLGQDIDVVIDLHKIQDLHSFAMGFLQNTGSWILMPARVDIYASSDGEKYSLVKSIPNTVDPRTGGTIISDFKTSLEVKARFLHVIARSQGKLPAWHNGAGQDGNTFADEIIVK